MKQLMEKPVRQLPSSSHIQEMFLWSRFCVDAPLFSDLSHQVLLKLFIHQLKKLNYSPVALLLPLTLKEEKKSLRAVKTCLYPTSGLTCGSSRQVCFLFCSRADRARSLWQPSGGRGPNSTQASSLADWPVSCPTETDSRSFFSDASSKRLLNNKVSSSDVIAQRFQKKRVIRISAVFFHSFSKTTAWLCKSIKELRLYFFLLIYHLLRQETEKWKPVKFKTFQGIWQ